MKIGINTYIKDTNRTQIIGASTVDLDEDEIVIIFGGIIPFNHLKKLIDPNTKSSDRNEVFSFESGVFEMIIYKLDS